MATDKIKLSKKQIEVVKAMRDGWILFTGLSDSTGRQYWGVSLGYENNYFNATVFSNLLSKGLIYQQSQHPFDWLLTELGKTIEL